MRQLTYCYSAHFLSGSWQTFPYEHPSLAQKEHNKVVLQATPCTYKTWSMFECHPQKRALKMPKKVPLKKQKQVKFFEHLLKNFCILCTLDLGQLSI